MWKRPTLRSRPEGGTEDTGGPDTGPRRRERLQEGGDCGAEEGVGVSPGAAGVASRSGCGRRRAERRKLPSFLFLGPGTGRMEGRGGGETAFTALSKQPPPVQAQRR